MSQSTPGRPPRRRLLLIAAAVAVVVVVAAIALALGRTGAGTGGSAKLTAAPTASTTATAPRTGAVTAGQASVCGLPGHDPAGATLTAVPATTWTTVGTMAAPSNPRIGPGRTPAGGLRSCYAHTTAGALFAMANIWAQGTDPRLTRLLLEQQTATGPGRTAALNASTPPSNTGLRAQIAGFRITSYTGDAATVDLAFQLNSGDLLSFPAALIWQDGDWKYDLADDGSPVFRPVSLTSLTGYIPWMAQQ